MSKYEFALEGPNSAKNTATLSQQPLTQQQLGTTLINVDDKVYKDELLNHIGKIIYNKAIEAANRRNNHENDINSIQLLKEASQKASEAAANFYRRSYQ